MENNNSIQIIVSIILLLQFLDETSQQAGNILGLCEGK